MYYELVFSMDELENGDVVWLVSVPAFPEIVTSGDTQEEAARAGLMAIEEAMAARIADGQTFDIPVKETSGKGRWVQLPLLTAVKAALHLTCLDRSVTRAELARLLGWHREQVDRLFRLDHKSQLDQLEAAYKALNLHLSFDFPLPKAA